MMSVWQYTLVDPAVRCDADDSASMTPWKICRKKHKRVTPQDTCENFKKR